jgi:hypothetical protein
MTSGGLPGRGWTTRGAAAGAGAFAAAVLGVCVWPATAQAYPQWQFSTGAARCNECHFAPAGSGLPTPYGRDALGEELTTFAGNGALLHGTAKIPRWLAFGGDLRGAFVAQAAQDPSGTTVAAFPMQADAELRAVYGAFSFYGTAGLRGEARGQDNLIPNNDYQPESTSRFISREHWLMWQPDGAVGPYARVGRFFAPFGLRLAEHFTYVRRELGFNQLQESYNVSGGYVGDLWEIHATVFAPDFIRHIGSDEVGAAAYYERRIAEQKGAVAGQVKMAVTPGLTRTIVGAIGKYYLEPLKTLFMAEADGVYLSFDDPIGNRWQAVGLAGLSVLPVRGVMATFLLERNQEDIGVAGASRTATTLLLNWFPYAHVEMQVMGRLDFPTGTPASKTFFAQLHYFL